MPTAVSVPRVCTPVFAAVALLVGSAVAGRAQVVPSGQTVGPDVTVINLTSVDNNGVFAGIRGYSIGTTSCNVGDAPVAWCNTIGGCGMFLQQEDHPVIAQNLYRLKDGRFSQIGMSWLKHGFLSTNSPNSACLPGVPCSFPPLGGDQLGVGCTDTYGASLNGSRPLGMRSEVDATTGAFPYPYTNVPFSGVDQWVEVPETDLDPSLNVGATYYAEGQYVTADDAQAGNGTNNASWAPATVQAATYNISIGGTVREQSAIEAWPAADPGVELIDVDVLATLSPLERFHVARKVTTPQPGTWHYEYAIHNMNSNRSAQRLAISFGGGAAVTNIGFKDIDHHSGEPYDNTDWTSGYDAASGTVSWETELFATNPDANALRWGTLFNFWFDADAPPTSITREVLTLFQPGTPCRLPFSYSPSFIFSDDFETGDFCSWNTSAP